MTETHDTARRRALRLGTLAITTTAVLFDQLVDTANAATDPRPEFSATTVNSVLDAHFGTDLAADDASIELIAPLTTERNKLVPFKVRAPGASRIAILFDGNEQPLVLCVDRRLPGSGYISARARLARSGFIHCYALRGDQLGRVTRKINVTGHWRES